MKPLTTLLIVLVAATTLAGCLEGSAPAGDSPNDGSAPATGCASTKDSSMGGDAATWVLDTSMGVVRITLHCDKTPLTAQHFVNLTEDGYFDGTKFHRVIKDFMNQGGDPLTKDDSQSSRWGTGGPGFTIKDEFYCEDGSVTYAHPADCELGLLHDKPGVLSMANTGRPETGGSQFFITAVPTAWLDGKHAVFGEVADEESLEVALAINKVETGQGDRPVTPVVIQKATVEWP